MTHSAYELDVNLDSRVVEGYAQVRAGVKRPQAGEGARGSRGLVDVYGCRGMVRRQASQHGYRWHAYPSRASRHHGIIDVQAHTLWRHPGRAHDAG